MSEQYPDLGITQKQDGDYWDVVIPDLDCNTDYALQAAWVFSDKSLGTSEFSDRFNFRTPAPSRVCPASVVATWDAKAGLSVTWVKNDNRVRNYVINLQAGGYTRSYLIPATGASVNYSWVLTRENNIFQFGGTFRKSFTSFSIQSVYGDGSSDQCPVTVEAYVDPVCTHQIADASWKIISQNNGILVSWQDDATSYGTYRETRVYVSESNSPYNWDLRYTGIGPASITLDTLATVYVKLNHLSYSDCESLSSSIKEAKAFDPIQFDDTPPDPVVNPSAVWNARDLDVSFTMPAINLPTYVKVHLVSGSKTRSFEKPVSGVAASTATTVKITRAELIDAFGSSPSSFTNGYVTDMDIYRNENTTQVIISGLSSAVKPNPLSGTTTTISVTPVSNGYIVSSNLNLNATGIRIYQSATENGTYTLVASSNSSPVIVYDEANAGNTVWVKGQWTCEEGLSDISAASSVTIIDVASLSLIENPVKIKTNGSIFAGTLDSNDNPVLSGARMLINKRGLFLYDSNDLNGTNPTTQIIGEDNGITATFITQKAKIANWVISSNKIENTLNATTGTYSGLSPSGAYSFWAGAGVPGGYSVDANEDAKFSVTSAGAVVARNIKVLGGEIQVGSKFKVDTEGLIKAVDANLVGTIRAKSGTLGSIDIGGTFINPFTNASETVDGQLRVAANGGTVEIGKFTSTNPDFPATLGVQVTSTASGKIVQLDPTYGIIATKGTIGGWTIDSTSINKAGNIGFFATTTPGDVAIWAGGSRTVSPNFSVTYAGKLVARDAVLKGMVQTGEAYFGTLVADATTATGYKLDQGWKVDGADIRSTNVSSEIRLNGLQGSIIGGNIVGSNHYFTTPSVWNTANPGSGSGNPGGIDYISSTGNFRLANGKLTYNGSEFNVQTDLVASNMFLGTGVNFSNDYLLGKDTTIPATGPGGVTKTAGSFSLGGGAITYNANTRYFEINGTGASYANFKIRLNVTSNEDNTFGDSTIVQDSSGNLTTGRAFYYGGATLPTAGSGATARSTAQDPTGRPFVKGDIWLSRTA
jgi:hypothetical protein